jgi:hypothetical protein
MQVLPYENNALFLSLKIPSKKSSEKSNNYVMRIEVMQCMFWKVEVKT